MIVTKLKIRVYPDPCLRKRSAAVDEVGPSERLLIASMMEAMHDHKGIGLAAPQVGINSQIFVADIGDGPNVFINPRIIRKSGREIMEEGCLSLPGVLVKVWRPKKVIVTYLDENGQSARRECEGLLARVVLHETDHLRGKLIIDYVPWRQRLSMRRKLKKIREKKENHGPDSSAPNMV